MNKRNKDNQSLLERSNYEPEIFLRETLKIYDKSCNECQSELNKQR